jgi:hypothetical protein
MAKDLNPQTMRRLALSRYLYTIGVNQSFQPEPLAGVSILAFHDSVEIFLQVASEHLDVSGPKGKEQRSFMGYWDD